jgi:NAD(P)H dehydrogenase (quinone)
LHFSLERCSFRTKVLGDELAFSPGRQHQLGSKKGGSIMFAVTGITGQVGGAVAQNLLTAQQKVRAVVRDASKGEVWAQRGCTVALADVQDASALATAFAGVDAVFVLAPPNFDPSPDFREARTLAKTLRSAIDVAQPKRVVYLSTIGAQAARENLLTQHTIIEKALRDSPVPITFLRPGWFIENYKWDVPAAKNGVIPSFLQPLNKAVPMVATADIGRVAAELLQQNWDGHRIVELEGPSRVTPEQAAATFAKVLGHPVRAEVVPRETWESLFRSQGMQNPVPRIQMLDGFNQGWIAFEGGCRKGTVTLDTVLRQLVEDASDSEKTATA